MVNDNIKYFAGSFIWGVIAKSLDAIIKFITTPLLLIYFGKDNFGLITLAISINAYISILDMGMNTGSIKFFSQWLEKGDYELIDRVSRTNLTFYLGIGIINSFILLLLALYPDLIFNININQLSVFQNLLIILSIVSLFNWSSFVFNQLLIADEKIGLVQQLFSIRSVLLLIVVLLTINLNFSLTEYFIGYIIINSLIIIPYCIICLKRKLVKSLRPAFYWKDFSIVLKYSLAIFAISLFQFTATQSRPLILAMFSVSGVDILSDYRVIEVFPIFIISIGGMLISIFLPKASKSILNNNRNEIEKFAYKGTLYTSILTAILCFPVMLVSKDLLTLYVGAEYADLNIWLSLWAFTLVLFLHNSPVASLVLASGKTKMLICSSAIACIISIIINAILCPYFGVGSAVLGYLVYILIQMSFYYLYFNSKVLALKSLNIFKAFLFPTFLGILISTVIILLKLEFNNIYIQIIVKCGLFLGIYIAALYLLRIILMSKFNKYNSDK